MNYWDQLDEMVRRHQEAQRLPRQGTLTLAPGKLPKLPRTPITAMELSIVEAMQRSVTFPAGGAHKRFIRDTSAKSQLSDSGRQYLAYIAHRYRRQWTATQAQAEWIIQWGNWIEVPNAKV